MTWRGDTLHELTAALGALRSAVSDTAYPLDLPSAQEARAAATALVQQADDYLLPRLARLDAPLLVVVGGATGGGKSTLVNSLVRAPVSPAGVVRPTTRSPVLVCNPADTPWFRDGGRLGGFVRSGGHTPDPYRLQLVAAHALPPGLALLDTPDVDSVVEAHRDVATQLLAAADLWLFVTTASRYADAVPWELLRGARDRGAAVALVLDRVPHHAAAEVPNHLAEMLGAQGFAGAPMFILPETWVDGQGMLPEAVTAPLRQWLEEVAADRHSRGAIVAMTLDGALAALPTVARRLAVAAEEQYGVAEILAEQVGLAYGSARSTVEHGVRSGTMLRGEVLARWEELVRAGEWNQLVAAGIARWRGQGFAPSGRLTIGQELRQALTAGLISLVRSAAADAADVVNAVWRSQVGLVVPPPPQDQRLERLVHEWQRSLAELVRTGVAGLGQRHPAPFTVNATGLLVMLGVFAAATTAGTRAATGAEELAAVLADPAVRPLAERARADLLDRLSGLLDEDAGHYLRQLAEVPADRSPAQRLRQTGAEVERTRLLVGLTGPVAAAPAHSPDPATAGYAVGQAADPGAGPAHHLAEPDYRTPAARQEAGR